MIKASSTTTPIMGEIKVLEMPKQDQSEETTHFVATFKDNGEPLFKIYTKNTHDKLALIQSVRMKMDMEYEEVQKSLRGLCHHYTAVA
jgi:hypothetical protein